MSDTLSTRELIVRLLEIGGAPEEEALFDLLVLEAPKLVGAEECSIFWRDGAWREKQRQREKTPGPPDAFYRRATYAAKKRLIGIDYYRLGDGLTGWVAKHGESLRIDDITDEVRLKKVAKDLVWKDMAKGFRDSTDKERQKAFLAVPVKIDGEVQGVIRIAKTAEPHGKFTNEAQGLLEVFAEHVAAIIQRVEEERLKDLWETLYLSGISFSKDEFSEYLHRVADEIPGYLGARACSIFLIEWYGNPQLRLCATTTGGPLAQEVGQSTYEIGEGLTGWVAKHNRSLCLKNVDDEQELKQHGGDLVHKGKHEEYIKKHSSFLASPISIHEQVLGVIRIAQDSQGRFFSTSDQRLLEYFCKNLAVLVQNVALFQRVQIEKDDALQRLRKNQRALKELAGSLKNDVISIKKSLSELFPDIDEGPTMQIGPVIVERVPRNMKTVFVGIPFSPYYKNVYEFAIRPALEGLDLCPWIAFEKKSVIDIMRKIFNGIQQSHIAIIDISEWNANVLFELGVLYGQNHPVILIKREDADVPADLAGLEYIPYGEFSTLADDLKQHLTSLTQSAV